MRSGCPHRQPPGQGPGPRRGPLSCSSSEAFRPAWRRCRSRCAARRPRAGWMPSRSPDIPAPGRDRRPGAAPGFGPWPARTPRPQRGWRTCSAGLPRRPAEASGYPSATSAPILSSTAGGGTWKRPSAVSSCTALFQVVLETGLFLERVEAAGPAGRRGPPETSRDRQRARHRRGRRCPPPRIRPTASPCGRPSRCRPPRPPTGRRRRTGPAARSSGSRSSLRPISPSRTRDWPGPDRDAISRAGSAT